MVYILGLFAIIIGGGFIVAIMDIACEAHENWQKSVTAEDLKRLGEFIKK